MIHRKLLALVFFCLAASPSMSQQWGHYTLYSTMNGTTTYLVDTNGTNFKTWSHTSTNRTCYSSHLLPGGTLLRSVARSGNSFTGGPICGQVQKLDWNGNVIWDFVYSTTDYCTHHDIHPMPNGNVLLIAYERKTAAEVTAAGCSLNIEIWSEKIIEVEPVGLTGGNIVWEWKAWDHLVQNYDSTKANYHPSIVNNPQLLNINYLPKKDWIHMNGVSYNPMLDQITWSSHYLNEIYVIDHSTTTAEAAGHTGGNSGKGGDILYRWGNPAAYGATGTQILKVCHDAHWNPENVPNPGYLSGFNNQGISSSQSSADYIDPPYNGYNYSITSGSAFTPSSYTFRQAVGGYTSNMGGSQVLPNGNMIVSQAIAGVIKEFSPSGTLLWSKTATGSVPKAFRYDSCYIFNTPPAIPTVSLINDTLFSSPATTYQWYYNGYQIPGATNAYYVPTQSGNYKVRITDANGCVLRYSADYYQTISTGVAPSPTALDFNVYPNPTSGWVTIEAPSVQGDYRIILTDEIGKTLRVHSSTSIIDMSTYKRGIYFITLITQDGTRATRKISYIP
jgi:hypothetical protein